MRYTGWRILLSGAVPQGTDVDTFMKRDGRNNMIFYHSSLSGRVTKDLEPFFIGRIQRVRRVRQKLITMAGEWIPSRSIISTN
jgi:hypothetical protein